MKIGCLYKVRTAMDLFAVNPPEHRGWRDRTSLVGEILMYLGKDDRMSFFLAPDGRIHYKVLDIQGNLASFYLAPVTNVK
jgi:hypothetical protein